MSRWAVVADGVVVDVVLWDGVSAWSTDAGELVAAADGVGPGWAWDGEAFHGPDPLPLSWDAIRGQRDRLLEASDWTQVADAPVDAAAWAVYRQQLRDIPQNFDSPDDVVWPEAP